MNRVYIKTYGCQMNERDSASVAAALRTKGYTMVDEESDADIVLVNTCSVRDLATDGVTKERALLMHHQREAIQSAMDIVLRIYHDYKVNYEITSNGCCIKVVANSQLGNTVKTSV